MSAEKEKFPVAIYGAGATANALFTYVNKAYEVVCFCDSDKRKWGGKLFGLPILDYRAALERFDDLHFYIAANLNFKFEIMDALMREGISRDRIVNYEPYAKYVSCPALETRIGFSNECMVICSSSFGKHRSPVMKYTGNPRTDVDNYIKIRDGIIDIANGKTTNIEGVPKGCIGCPDLKERFWPLNRRITEVSFCIKYRCNFGCIYCVQEEIDRSVLSGEEHLNEALETMDIMKSEGIMDELAVVYVAPTEISVYPYKEKLMEHMKDYLCQFNTNASVYVPAVAESLKKGGKLLCSMDAGTVETFMKVKRVGEKMYQQVLDNLKMYSASGSVEMKYIFMQGVNDNVEDIEGFVDACEYVNAVSVNVTRNTYEYGKATAQEMLDAIAYLISLAMKRGFTVNCSPLVFLPEEYKYIQAKVNENKEKEE